MLKDEQTPTAPNAIPFKYIAWYYSGNEAIPGQLNDNSRVIKGPIISAKEAESLRTASTLRELAGMLMNLCGELLHTSQGDLFFRRIDRLEVVAYFKDGREFFVPQSLYLGQIKHGFSQIKLDKIPEHFPNSADLKWINDMIESDLAEPNQTDLSYENEEWSDFEEDQEKLYDDAEDLPALVEPEPIPEPEVENIIDARERVAASVVRRRGQPEFRKALIQAYNSECAVTGCNAVEALEAAHISPYRGPNTNHPSNGLLLRADLHTLFDLGLIAIDTQTMTVVLAESLANTTYAEINGRALRPPKNESFRPNVRALDKHRSESKVS